MIEGPRNIMTSDETKGHVTYIDFAPRTLHDHHICYLFGTLENPMDSRNL